MVPSRRDLLVGGAALVAVGTAVASTPRRSLMLIGNGQLKTLLPSRVGPWSYETASGLVVPPPDQLARLLYDQQEGGTYSAPGEPPVMLLMAYGSSQGGMLQIHRPEICYPASGFRLSATHITDIPTDDGRVVAAQSFIAQSDTRIEQVLYWTRIGNMLATSWSSQRIAVARNNLAGLIPDGLLVRLSTLTDDPMRGQATLQRFAKLMLAGMPLASRRMLIGSDAG